MAHLSEIESPRQPGENEQPGGGFEQLGPQNRLLTELSRLETGGWEAWILVGFAVAVLALGILSFFPPRDFWTNHPLTVSFTIPPVALFVVMIALVIFALSLVRRERTAQDANAERQSITGGAVEALEQHAGLCDPRLQPQPAS